MNTVPFIVAKCLIIENDCSEAQKVRTLLEELPYIKVMGVATDICSAMEIVRRNQTLDMVVLGTGNKNLHAFDIAAALRDLVACMVFVGDDSQSALKAFGVGADHFFAKPLHYANFNLQVSDLIIKKLQGREIKVTSMNLRIPVQIIN